MQKSPNVIAHPERRAAERPALARVLQRGIEFQRAQRFREAEHQYHLVLRQDPEHPDALNLLGTLAAEAKRYDKSIELLEHAVKARPKDPNIRNNLANAYILDNQHEKAIPHLRRAIKAKPRFLEALCNLGRALRGAGRQAQAIEWFDKALAIDGDYRSALVGRSETLAELGRMKEAEAGFRTVIARYPDDAHGHFGLSGTRKFTAGEPEAEVIERMLSEDGRTQIALELLHSAAGKIRNDQQRYDEAFAHYQKAKEISGRDFDIATYSAFVDQMISLFTPLLFATRKGFGDPSERPVFIVGMPRSGTTLTEQIISSHPQVHGAGELQHMQRMIRRIAGRLRESDDYVRRLVDGLDRQQCLGGAKDYLCEIGRLSASAMRVTDKMPHNYEVLGVIALVFPNARIIHCRRDPLDNCVSCFTHRFNSFHGYNADLTKLGLYYRQYDRLMAHWRAVLPNRMLEVQYEDTIADQVGVSRRLIDFLGLDWDDACLAYHESERSVRTLSRWQVRQPIYRSSVKRWRNYEAHLGPLISALGPLADTG